MSGTAPNPLDFNVKTNMPSGTTFLPSIWPAMSESTTGLIFKKMSQVMADIGTVTKDQKNTMQGYSFRGVDQFVNALHPALIKHGVFLAPKVVAESHEIREVERNNGKKSIDKHVHLMVQFAFFAEDGSCVTIGPIASEGLDSGDKATNKALSAALKYALIQTFAVPTQDMEDADRESPEIAPKAAASKKEEAPVEQKVVDTEEKKEEAKSSSFFKPSNKKVEWK